MKHIIKSTVKVLKAEYVVDLMSNLNKRSVPLRSVRVACNRLCNDVNIQNRSNTITNSIMNWKLQDAYRCVDREKYINSCVWREYISMLTEYRVYHVFVRIWKEEKSYQRNVLKNKRKSKITHLTQIRNTTQFKPKEPKVEQVRGILIKDQTVPTDMDTKPRIYGDITVKPEAVDLLSLGPKFAVYDNINKQCVAIEVEKAIEKLRF